MDIFTPEERAILQKVWEHLKVINSYGKPVSGDFHTIHSVFGSGMTEIEFLELLRRASDNNRYVTLENVTRRIGVGIGHTITVSGIYPLG